MGSVGSCIISKRLYSEITLSLNLHSLLGHFKNFPSRLVSLETRKAESHWGQVLATGLSQDAKVQSGYLEHPKKSFPRLDFFSTMVPSHSFYGQGTPVSVVDLS